MIEAERISKYWTDTYTQEQFELCVQRCVKRLDTTDSIILTFKDNSIIIFFEDGRWEVQI